MLIVMNNNNRDELKDFIQKNRGAFEELKAPTNLWDQIEPNLDPNPKKDHTWQKGLMIGLLLAIAAFVIGYTMAGQDDHIGEELNYQKEALEFASLPDFEETQQYYETQVHQVWNEIQLVGYDESIANDLELLNQNDQELQEELKEAEGIYKEHILQAMIQNQQIKLNLLMSVLNELQESEQQKQRKHEII